MTDQGQDPEGHPTPPARPSVEFRPGPVELSSRPRPTVVSVSYGFWLVACLGAVVTAAVTLLEFDARQQALLTIVEREFPNEAVATRDDVATLAVAVLIGFGVVVALLQLMVSLSMHAGRRAARPVLVLLAVIGAGYVAAVYQSVPVETQIGLIVTLALTAVAIILMFSVPPGIWFTGKAEHFDVYE